VEGQKEDKLTWQSILGWLLFLVPVATIAKEALSSEPLDRYAVFAISISVASLLFMATLEFVINMMLRLLEVQVQSMGLHVRQIDLSKRLIKAFRRSRDPQNRRLTTGSTKRRR
jgi:hypothetical protein